ncbi:RHS repeat-associated core domain-containing protein [Alkalihalobacillus sp. AL-G]|uniref:RHS repeat-associated core domain-containing protein n=1 Tax=Alkalihalobacillus sp. AL-G TaxID=2926399 RepID=UPI00272DBB85|nr:RHS repeat-associated core domain-containing protein [Alkalihalobacillus sp. AL-G]WLD94435.1 RHS repeat-associated core domain-containing protein [Alkalihalobacillus sp. AL-G]
MREAEYGSIENDADLLAGISGNGLTTSYKYNVDGIRTEKMVNGVTTSYHLDGDLVTYETNGTDEIYYTYSSNDKLVSMNLKGEEYFYLRNNQGDITGLADESGTEVVSYQYDTWGKLISITGTLADTVGKKNPYRYRGYRYDSETGLYYLNARYYNPEWSRFLNADSYGGEVGELLSHNVFAYCANNPINNVDSSGHWYARIGRYSGSASSGGTVRTNEKLGDSIQIANPSYEPESKKTHETVKEVTKAAVIGGAGSTADGSGSRINPYKIKNERPWGRMGPKLVSSHSTGRALLKSAGKIGGLGLLLGVALDTANGDSLTDSIINNGFLAGVTLGLTVATGGGFLVGIGKLE